MYSLVLIESLVLMPILPSLKVLVVVETRDKAHAAEMVCVLKERYTNLTFTGHGEALGITIESESSEEENGESDSNEEIFANGTDHALAIPRMKMRRSSIRIQTIH